MDSGCLRDEGGGKATENENASTKPGTPHFTMCRATQREGLQPPACEPQLSYWLWNLGQAPFPCAMGQILQAELYA